MRDGDWLIGYGCATACYPTHLGPATARVTLRADGKVKVEVAGQDSGQGTYTALGQIAAHELGIDPRRVRVMMGDSKLPAGPSSSNSMGTASIGSAVKIATDKVLLHFGGNLPDDEDHAAAFARLGLDEISELGEFLPPGTEPEVLDTLRKGQVPFANQARGDESKGDKPLMSPRSPRCPPPAQSRGPSGQLQPTRRPSPRRRPRDRPPRRPSPTCPSARSPSPRRQL